MEGNIGGNNSCTKGGVVGIDQKKQGRPQEQLNCPRCNSSNTKFCYYNNYSLTQPRYFCKTCRRYWTEGGSLRNVPVGGGSRKNKKLPSSSSSSSSSTRLLPDLNPPAAAAPSTTTTTTTTSTCATISLSSSSSQNPKILMQGGQDLNLAFPPMMEKYDHGIIGIGSTSSSSSSSYSNSSSALELLRAGMVSRGLNNYGHHHNPILMMPNSNSNALFPSGFSYNHHPMQEVKPSLGFSVDHHHHHPHLVGSSSRYGSTVHQEDHINSNGGGRLLFPFGDVKQIPPPTHQVEQNKEQGNSSTGFWTGMIGEGSW